MTGCKPERQEWVDMAKGIAIIAVVMGHIGFCWPHSRFLPLNVLLIWLWHVPVFFMIGGFFLDDKKLVHPVAFIKRKLKTLYLPLLYVYVPVLLLHNVFISSGIYDVGTNYSGHHVSWWGATDYVVQGIKSLLLVGQEPLLGAMWFVFVLFWAQTLLSVSSNLLRKTGRQWEQNTFDLVRYLVLLCLAVLSWSLTAMGYTKMLFSVTLVAAWLIYVGMLLMRRLRPQFDNGIVALICVVIAWHASCSVGGVNLVDNRFHDVITLTVSALACLYVVCYVAKLIECRSKMLTAVLSTIGRDSFYIMGLHFAGFKICTVALDQLGWDIPLAELVPPVGHCAGLFFCYVLFGVGFPLLLTSVLRRLKAAVGHRTIR